MLLPVLRTSLLSGISPEVGVLYIYQKLHIVLGCTFAYHTCNFNIIVSSAIGMTVSVIRLIPHPYTDIVHAVFSESFEYILFLTGFIIEFNSGIFKGDYRRYVNATNSFSAVYFAVKIVKRYRLFCRSRNCTASHEIRC